MHHAFIDIYSDLNTPLHRLSPKVKIISLSIFLLLIILSPIKYSILFLSYVFLITILIVLAKIPLKLIFLRIIETLPFIVIIALSVLFKKEGFVLFINCIIKAILAIVLLSIISSTTKFNYLLEALGQLRFPVLLIQLLSFMYRYSFLLEDQFLRTQRAYLSRGVNQRNNFKQVKILSNILGTVFIRTYERAERVYLAMCARGYQHEESH